MIPSLRMRVVALFVLPLFLAAGCTARSSATPPSVTITGVVSVPSAVSSGAPLRSASGLVVLPTATVSVYRIDDHGIPGLSIASATTDSTDHYSIALPAGIDPAPTLLLTATVGATTLNAVAIGATVDIDPVSTYVFDRIIYDSIVGRKAISRLTPADVTSFATTVENAVGSLDLSSFTTIGSTLHAIDAAVVFACSGIGCPKRDDVATLLTTKACVGCDLSFSDLSGQNLAGVDLAGANLSFATLTGATLTDAKLANARLIGIDGDHAELSSAGMTSSDLTDANLVSATMNTTNLTNAVLINVDLTDADLTSAVLTGANLVHANPYRTILTATDLGLATWIDGRPCKPPSIGVCNY